MKSAVQVLTEARELLSDESRWTSGVVARLDSGRPTHAKDGRAACFCSLGAIYSVEDQGSNGMEAIGLLQRLVGTSVSYFNDAPERKHSEVLEAFDKAIVLAKEQECS